MSIEITSRENPLVKWVVSLQKSGAKRRQEGVFAAEGPVVLREALAARAAVDKIFVTDGAFLESAVIPKETEVYMVSPPVMEKMSQVKTSQGVVFTCHMPKNGVLRGPKIMALENLSDPGNMGTIIRTAEAFGIDTLALVGSYVDVFSPKVVRAAMGAVLRVNICSLTLDELEEGVKSLGLPLYGAALRDDAVGIKDVSLSSSAVMIGNEASGLSQAALDKCVKNVIIPISGIQSLNAAVASAIFMFEMSRR